jgi:acylphosphatase
VQRMSVWFSGRVQGVGFRATVVRLARQFEVTGRVCNLSDGRVELEAEGERAELENFRNRIAQEMKRHITSQTENWSAAAGHWTTFEVAADR